MGALLNEAAAWVIAHVGPAVDGSPYAVAAVVVVAAWLAVRILRKIARGVLTAAVVAAAVILALRVLGVGA